MLDQYQERMELYWEMTPEQVLDLLLRQGEHQAESMKELTNRLQQRNSENSPQNSRPE